MNYQIIYTDAYNKRAAKFLKKYPQLKKTYQKALELLELNPYHPSLRIHTLQGKLQGLYSVSMNISYCITFEFLITEKRILLVNVGDHATVY